jgi:hypothetical protein
MFELYTEAARRSSSWNEASEAGSPQMESEHFCWRDSRDKTSSIVSLELP